jgi:hypothetical protein
VPPGGSFNYYSGILGDISDQDEQLWINQPICSGADGAGFRVTVATNGNSVNQQHVILCAGPSLSRVNQPPAEEPPPKRKKNNDRKRKRNNQRKKKKR